MDRLYEKLERVVEEIGAKEKLTASDIQIADWATHAQKSILCKEQMLDDEYSGSPYYGRSMARRRDSMGRYSRTGTDSFTDHLRSALDAAPDERTRQGIHRMMREIEG